MHDQINAWLLEPTDYAEGLQLLMATGRTGIVIKTLSMGEDAYTRNRLEAELQKWVAEPQIVLPIGPATGSTAKQSIAPITLSLDYGISNAQPVMSQVEQDGKVTVIRDQTYDLLNERAELKARIRAFAGDDSKHEQRRDWAFRILSIGEQLDELYSRLDFFNQYGYMPPKDAPEANPDDTAALMNMRSYVSRYQAKLRKTNLTPKQRQSAEEKLKQYSDEKARLELKLIKQPNDSHKTGQQTSDRPIHHPTLPGT